MADYSIPLQVQQPNTLGMLGNLVNTAQGIQAFQSGAIQQQRLGINLQSEQQANQERKNVIGAMQAGDPDLQADPASGLIDIPKATAKLQRLAPQTYNTYLQSIQTSNSNNNKLNDQLIGLDKDARDSLSGIAAAGVNQPVSVTQDTIRNEWLPNNPSTQAQRIGNQLLSSLDKAQGDQKVVDSILQTAALRTKAVPDIIAARQAGTAPSTIATPEGPRTAQIVTQPNWSGVQRGSIAGVTQAPGIGPGETERLEQDPVSQQAVIVRRAANGSIVSARPAAGLGGGGTGQGPATSAFTPVPQGETVQTMSQLQQMRAASNAAAQKTGEQAFNNKQILSLLQNGATATGSNAPFIQKWMGSVGLQWTNDEATNLNRISHFLALQQQSNEQTMGVRTDAGREVSGLASGSIQMTTPALQSAVKANDSLVTGTKAFNTGLETAISKGGIGAARTFQNSWANNFDPIVTRYTNAIRDGDKTEQKAIEKQYGKGTPAWGIFQAKLHALNNLETTGSLTGQ